jgi:hypothetical protein
MQGLPPDDDLAAWIADLRSRLARGDLATVAAIDIGYGTSAVPAERLVRIMLADLDSFEDLGPDEAVDPVNLARRTGLLADFRVLKLLLD